MKLKALLTNMHVKILSQSSMEKKVKYLRGQGVKIGQGCGIRSMSFSTEPYLIELGNKVTVACGVKFITHEGSIKLFGDNLDGYLYGKIKIGNNVFIGINCIILLNTTIGDNCIIGAGSIVRGQFPDNSVIVGNPAKVVLNMSIQRMLNFNNPGFVKMNPNPTVAEKDRLVKKHFGID